MKSIPLFKPYYSSKMNRKIDEILKSGAIASGQYVDKFSKEFSYLIENDKVVLISDMTSALIIALRIAGVNRGDKVITTSFSCMSTNSAIASLGAKPVWVDIDPESATVDVDSLYNLLEDDCKAMILYHVSGYPGPVKEIKRFCESNNIFLIEDCNNSLLAKYNGCILGNWGKTSIHSFYPNRLVNTIEGSAIVCSNNADLERATKLRKFGIDFKSFRGLDGEIDLSSDISEIGLNASLNNISSAIGFIQLESVHIRLNKHRKNAKTYDDAFSNTTKVTPIKLLPGAEPSYWTYLIRSDKSMELLTYLKKKNIGCSKLHTLTHHYSGFGTTSQFLPGSEELLKTIIAIPCGYWLTSNEIQYIIESIVKFDQ